MINTTTHKMAGARTKLKRKPSNKKPPPKKTNRKKIEKQIGINVPISRVRKHINVYNVNKKIEEILSYYKEKKKFPAEHKQFISSKIKNSSSLSNSDTANAISKLRFRFTGDSSIYLASGIDYLVKGVIKSCIKNTVKDKKAIIKVKHIFNNEFNNSECITLLSKLSIYKQAEENLTSSDENTVESEPDSESSVVDFKHYMNNAFKTVKDDMKDSKYDKVRISKPFRVFLSDVVVQFIQSISPFINLYLNSTKKKTVNYEVIEYVFKQIYLFNGMDYSKEGNMLSYSSSKLAKLANN